MVYRNDTLQFMPTPEGRVLYKPLAIGNKWEYEYQYKDHLGNLRLAFRKQPTEVKAASMEALAGQQEEADFDNVVLTRFSGNSRTGNDVARLNAAQGKPIGPMRQFSVQRGDSLSLAAFANYPQPAGQSSLWSLLSFVSSWFTATPQSGSENYAATNKFTPYLSLGLNLKPINAPECLCCSARQFSF